jgi:hypothetical protein
LGELLLEQGQKPLGDLHLGGGSEVAQGRPGAVQQKNAVALVRNLGKSLKMLVSTNTSQSGSGPRGVDPNVLLAVHLQVRLQQRKLRPLPSSVSFTSRTV